MRKMFQVFVLAVLTVSLTITAMAQKQKSKDEYLKEISTLSNTKKPDDLEKAYQLSKEFFTVYPNEKGDNINKLKEFIKRYRESKFFTSIDSKKFADAFAIGKDILADEPEKVDISLNLAYGGYSALAQNGDKKYADESTLYAKQTLELMQKGIFPKHYAPFNNKEESLAWMYYIIGNFSQDKDIKTAATSFYKAIQYETQIKKSSQPYLVIANYYESVYEQMAKDKAEEAKVKKVIEQMLDAYARAYTLGTSEKNPGAESWKQRLAQIYKFSKGTDAGFDAYVKYIVTTPFADPSQF